MTKVDILNCMGLAMLCLSAAAVFDTKGRIRFALLAGIAAAAAAPLVANLPWGDTPPRSCRSISRPAGQGRGRFPLFPNAAYLAFGLAIGSIVKARGAGALRPPDAVGRADRFRAGVHRPVFLQIPYSIYTKTSFWTDNPALVVIRAGIALLLMGGCYLWTEYCVGPGWSWMQTLGKNSLMVYWVHVMLVYGDIFKPVKRALSYRPWTAMATMVVESRRTEWLRVSRSVGWL